jgi:hypothetical protein
MVVNSTTHRLIDDVTFESRIFGEGEMVESGDHGFEPEVLAFCCEH